MSNGKKSYDGDSPLNRLFNILFWLAVGGGVLFLVILTLALGFSTGPRPAIFNELVGFLLFSLSALPLVLLGLYRGILYIIYGSRIDLKFGKYWLAAFIPAGLLIILLVIGYLLSGSGIKQEPKISKFQVPDSDTRITVPISEQADNLNKKNTNKITKPLISIRDATKIGNFDAVKQHLEAGTDVNSTDSVGYTSLDIAKARNHTKIFDFIKRNGGKSGSEFSIFIACDLGDINAINMHIKNGINLNQNDEWGLSPMAYAFSHNHNDIQDKEIVELLLANGADVNHKSDDGFSPLHKAAVSGTRDSLELLLKNGAKVNAQPQHSMNYTPLDEAIRSNNSENIELLRKNGGKTREELKRGDSNVRPPAISIWEAALDGNILAIKQHLASGTNVDVKKIGETPLAYASLSGQTEAVRYLISMGANVNTKNKINETPLFHAASQNHTDVVSLLIAHGANVNAKNHEGRMPLEVAERANTFGQNNETIELLREKVSQLEKEYKALKK